MHLRRGFAAAAMTRFAPAAYATARNAGPSWGDLYFERAGKKLMDMIVVPQIVPARRLDLLAFPGATCR